MSRLFWTAMGVTAGVMVTRKVSAVASALTPEGAVDRLAGSLGTLGEAIREFGQDLRDAMWDREEELHEALGLNDVPPEPAARTVR